jgi:hypothetical protein
MTKGKKPDKTLVVLGFDDNPYRYDAAVWVAVVERDWTGPIKKLQRGERDKFRIHAQAPVKNASLVGRFLNAVKSVKGARIGGDWYRVEQAPEIGSATMFMNGECTFSTKHRLAYLSRALAGVPELVAC